jgi:hypothetical protein
MKKALLIAALLLALAGCGVKQVPVTITNDLGAWDITEVYIDASDKPWSTSLLQATLTPGNSAVFQVAPGTYDIRCTDEDGDTYTKWEVVIGAEGHTWNVTLADLD